MDYEIIAEHENFFIYSSKEKGRGLIAKRNFKQNELVMVEPFVELDLDYIRHTLLFDFHYHSDMEKDISPGRCHVVLGWGSMLSHCENENISRIWNPDKGLVSFYTLREISAGEEFVIDYKEELDFPYHPPMCLPNLSEWKLWADMEKKTGWYWISRNNDQPIIVFIDKDLNMNIDSVKTSVPDTAMLIGPLAVPCPPAKNKRNP